jgi:hypothetical protein
MNVKGGQVDKHVIRRMLLPTTVDEALMYLESEIENETIDSLAITYKDLMKSKDKYKLSDGLSKHLLSKVEFNIKETKTENKPVEKKETKTENKPVEKKETKSMPVEPKFTIEKKETKPVINKQVEKKETKPVINKNVKKETKPVINKQVEKKETKPVVNKNVKKETKPVVNKNVKKETKPVVNKPVEKKETKPENKPVEKKETKQSIFNRPLCGKFNSIIRDIKRL